MAESQLRSRFTKPSEALAVLEAMEGRRRKECFIKYWQPMPGQREAIAALTPDTKLLGLLGGNRSGKTEAGAAIVAAWALGKDYFQGEPAWEWAQSLPIPDRPVNIWVVGLDYGALRTVIWGEKFLHGRVHPGLIPKDQIAKVSEPELIIELKNGSVITGKSAEAGREKFQAASVDLVWMDEEPPVDIYDECYQRTVDCAGKLLLTLTPLVDISSGLRDPWVFDLKAAASPDCKFVQLSVLDNPYIPAEELLKLKAKWAGHVEEPARLYGDFFQRSGLVYDLWDDGKHLIEPRTFPNSWQTVVCIDPAPTGVTAALWCKADGEGNLYFYREYYEANKVVSEHAKGLLTRNQGAPVDLWLIDPKGGSQRNAETHKTIAQLYREAGIPVRLAEVTEDYGRGQSQEYMAATLNPTARHPKAWFVSTLRHFREERAHYAWGLFSRGEQRGLATGKPLKRNDHLMNCYQYICAHRPRARRISVQNQEDRERARANNSYT